MSGEDKNDARFMRAALKEARKGLGLTSPNPTVGAVLAAGDRILARGHHREAGAPHAEVACLRRVRGPIPPNGTLYVTLEPCSTVGRTAPCTGAIIEARVRTVVIGATDVNPRHSGRAIRLLQDAGIKVRCGVLAEECARLNEPFNKWIVTGRPFVIAKCGMSLDGRLTRPPGESQWITGAAARRDAHQLRADVDAILVGAETIRIDNPRLTVRDGRTNKQPLRIILSRSGSLPPAARIFTDRFAKRTLVYRDKSLEAVLKDLGQKKIISVLIEGGGEILGQALDGRLIDKLQVYIGGLLTGGPVLAFPGQGAGSTAEAAHLTRVAYRKIDNDICITGYPIFPNHAASE